MPDCVFYLFAYLKPIKPASFKKRVIYWHELVSETDFDCLDFKIAMARAKKDDVIYCDPPYTHLRGFFTEHKTLKLKNYGTQLPKQKAGEQRF